MQPLRLAVGVVVLLSAWSPVHADEGDLSGRWTGTWKGFGIFHIAREQPAIAELRQASAGEGDGRLILHDTGAAESVPLSLRLAGSTGVPVTFTLDGSQMTMSGSDGTKVDLTLDGDELVGRVRGDAEVALVLHRDRPDAAPADTQPAETAAPPPVVAAAPAIPAPAAVPEPAPAAEPAPEAERPRVTEFAEARELQTVYFDFDQATIRNDAKPLLEANATWLKAHADIAVLIEGHCDERGTNEYNLALGERRARAARDYLIALGIAADRLTTISYGEERPACGEKTEECWAQNRRALFRAKPQ